MKVPALFFALFLSTTALLAQQSTIKTSIYFEVDTFTLSNEHQKRLDKVTDTLKKLNIQEIVLRGNTDADADSAYNIRLSIKRVTSVKNYLAAKGIDLSKIKTDYYGENKPIADNKTETGKQKNRRVDIIASTLNNKEIEFTTIVQDSISAITEIRDTCGFDTTFTLPNGTIVIMNRCELLEQLQCGGIKITEFIQPQTLRDSAIYTMDVNGNTLISGGMLEFKTCNGLCLQHPITFLIKVKEDCEPPCTMSLWEETTAWKPLKNTSVKTVFHNGKKYLEFKITCPGFFNLDCSYSMQNLTIKIPRKYQLLEVRVTNDCPMWSYKTTINTNEKTHKVKICIICQPTDSIKNNYIYVKAISPKGDTVIVNHKRVHNLSFRYKLFPGHKCRGPKQKEPCPNILYYFGRGKSKIKIREKDFDIIIPRKKQN